MFSVTLAGLRAAQCTWLRSIPGHRLILQGLVLGITVPRRAAVTAQDCSAVVLRRQAGRAICFLQRLPRFFTVHSTELGLPARDAVTMHLREEAWISRTNTIAFDVSVGLVATLGSDQSFLPV